MMKGLASKKLADVAEVFDGPHATPKTVDEGPIFLGITALQDGLINLGETRHVTSADYKQWTRRVKPQAGDVVFSYETKLGEAAIIPPGLECCLGRRMGLIRFNEGMVIPRYFLYQYLSPLYQTFLDSRTIRGATVNRISIKEFPSFPIVVPALFEQQRVIGLLDEAFDGIATAKASAEKNLQNARALFASHLQSVFMQQGNGWQETELGAVCEFVGGSQPPKSVFSKIKGADNIRLIQIRDYKSDRHAVYIPRGQAKRFCTATDVMIGRYGPPLFQILRGLDGAYNVALMKAVPDESKIIRDFLFYFLKHSAILEYVIYHSSRAAGQIGVTKETLEPYPIALPSPTEQKKIVGIIGELEMETQSLASIYERKLHALETLKKSLLHRAFSGQL